MRDGPAVGVHCLMWCDTLINVNRAMDRALLRECTQRVLFQMSATDSSHLIDTPLASKLGPHVASVHAKDLTWDVEMAVHFREVYADAVACDFDANDFNSQIDEVRQLEATAAACYFGAWSRSPLT